MKLSMSNLAWQAASIQDIAPVLKSAGLDGIEIAPTVLWPEAPVMPMQVVSTYAKALQDYGLEVSGIQSLLFGKPDYQLLDRSTWPQLLTHLKSMIQIARALDAHVAVFGSPKNRIKGSLSTEQANDLATEFFVALTPFLQDNGVILTLEPNAPAYGADFLTHYVETVNLADRIDSPWIQPQIDTGCMSLVHEDSVLATRLRKPKHVHISAEGLTPPQNGVDQTLFSAELHAVDYSDWVVLEMLPENNNVLDSIAQAALWLHDTFKGNS
jgi:hypothetical protein